MHLTSGTWSTALASSTIRLSPRSTTELLSWRKYGASDERQCARSSGMSQESSRFVKVERKRTQRTACLNLLQEESTLECRITEKLRGATDNIAPKFPLLRPDLVNTLIAFISVLRGPQAEDFPERPRGTRPSVKNKKQRTSAIVAQIREGKSKSLCRARPSLALSLHLNDPGACLPFECFLKDSREPLLAPWNPRSIVRPEDFLRIPN